MNIDETVKFYSSKDKKIDFSTIYYYNKHKDIRNGLKGE